MGAAALLLPLLPVPAAEAASPHHSYHATNRRRHDRRRRRRRDDDRAGAGAGGRFGFSPPIFDMYGDDGEGEGGPTYFERYGLTPPPPVSRGGGSRKQQRRWRRAQAAEGTEPPGGADEWTDDSLEDYANNEEGAPDSELERIIRDAKRGEDANARLRYDLLWRHDGNFDKYYYDRHSYPWEYVWYNQTTKEGKSPAGLPVEVNINFHRVFTLDIVDSMMDLVVWFRLVWA